MSRPLLEVRDLSVRFGRVEALRSVSLDVHAGSVVGLIGANGAGKTTLIDAVAGVTRPGSGTVTLAGTTLDGLPPHRRARLGLARTFQTLELFEDLRVDEHLLVAAEAAGSPRPAADRALDAAGLAGLGGLGDRLPPALSHAERSRLALGRALAGGPRLLLLDEPAAGLDAGQRADLIARLRRLADGGRGVLLVDHDMGFVLDLCDRVVVLDLGRVIADGPPAAVRTDPAVLAAYLGPAAAPPAAAAAPTPPAPATSGPLLLEIEGLRAGYRGVPVVHGVDLQVSAGEVVVLLGANGAGKTTTLRAATGVLPATAGRVAVLGRNPRRRPHRLAREGLGHVPQGRALFPGLTVRQHLDLAARRRRSDFEPVLAVLPALRSLLDRPAGQLSGGEQQMLALARALVVSPRLLVVDELSLGLAPRLVDGLLATLRQVAGTGRTGVLVVEQHVHLALGLADRAYVMQGGRVVLAGPATALAADPAGLEAAYLGGLPPTRPG